MGSFPNATTISKTLARFFPLATLVIAAAGPVDAATPPAIYWRQRVFLIPYMGSPAAAANGIAKVELLAARPGVGDWRLLQSAEPTVRGFSFNAPADGAYDFAVRTVDRQGNPSVQQPSQPMLRVVVDTTQPVLKLAASADAAGRLVVRYEAADPNLVGESLRLEVKSDLRGWQPATLSPADVRQPDRVLGQWTWPATAGVARVELRGTIADRAGNQAVATTVASLLPSAADPALNAPVENAPAPLPDDAGPSLGPATASGDSFSRAPLGGAGRITARLVSDSPNGASQNPFGSPAPAAAVSSPAPSASGTFPLGDAPPLLAPSLRGPAGFELSTPSVTRHHPSPVTSFGAASLDAPAADQVVPTANDAWTAAPNMELRSESGRWVNSLTFDLDYELDSVGPWGVARVEIWATRDEGKTWASLGTDEDNRAPMRVVVPTAGVYGFRIVVDGANGATAPRPQAGDKPELTIGVDLEPPRAALMGCTQGQKSLANHLMIHWSAGDDHLEDRPISLFVGPAAEGPWTTIATDLANTGEYAWQLPRVMPEQIFLRLDVHDRAGNVTARRSPGPIQLTLPQPTGRIRAIRPVADAPSRDRTAAGAGNVH